MKRDKLTNIPEKLERAYRDFHHHFHREKDPVGIVHRYSSPKDQEVVGLYAALLAYGNVAIILKSLEKVLRELGDSPYELLISGKIPEFTDFRHRFTTGEDIQILSYWISNALQSHKSLENFFDAERNSPFSMKQGLSSFVKRFTSLPLPKKLQPVLKRRTRNLKYLISDPERGSACKRLNLYMRWMVREADGIDLGLWKSLSPKDLVLPVDTHLLKILRELKWTQSQQASWKVAESATSKLYSLFPNDPIRYDFALCHLSMSGKELDEKME